MRWVGRSGGGEQIFLEGTVGDDEAGTGSVLLLLLLLPCGASWRGCRGVAGKQQESRTPHGEEEEKKEVEE